MCLKLVYDNGGIQVHEFKSPLEGQIVAKAFTFDYFTLFLTAVVIDEVHERSVNTDLILALLKDTIKAREDFKVRYEDVY